MKSETQFQKASVDTEKEVDVEASGDLFLDPRKRACCADVDASCDVPQRQLDTFVLRDLNDVICNPSLANLHNQAVTPNQGGKILVRQQWLHRQRLQS